MLCSHRGVYDENHTKTLFSPQQTQQVMNNIPYYGPEDVKASLKYEELVSALELALADFSKGPEGGVSQPLRATAEVTKYNGFLAAMPAYVASRNALACKLVTFYPNNAAKEMDTHMAHVLLFDETSGEIKAIMDGEVITAMRTAAVSAIATKYLAEKYDILAVLGSGVQATAHIEAFCKMFPIKKINIWNHRTEGAEKLAKYVKESMGIEVQVFTDVQSCVEMVDVIIAATFATEPILKEYPMRPWVHINSVGAPRPQWQELSAELMNNSVVYVDSFLSANKESGDVIKSGAQIYAEIGEVILGNKKAEITTRTVFKSLGLALEDAVSARLVFDVMELNKKILKQ
ncbi:ketimine reductase mu-crystallin-like isoform X1 [Daphnia pulicaria]|uniref:ketimine reductase mu-crystallin-like isoform X1 n=2 Tax=Daphnia pulicaria TaxID=35523 RepID=UPI001EEBFD7C|nr:ketimine reductase mu-crystallin-like isoform X1 [Daphnia pulicaria]